MASLPDPTVQVVAGATDSTPIMSCNCSVPPRRKRWWRSTETALRFTHPILAHGVYSAAPSRRRREMHRRLAELVAEPELRARHLALSDATGKRQTVEALDTAAEIARARGAPAAAAELLELAMNLGGDDPKRRIQLCGIPFRCRGCRTRTPAARELSCRPPAGTLRAEALHQLVVVGASDGSLPRPPICWSVARPRRVTTSDCACRCWSPYHSLSSTRAPPRRAYEQC